jgi:PhnB protein
LSNPFEDRRGGIGDSVRTAGTIPTKERPMASRLNPYLSFRDNARQAIEFYRSVFGGNLTLHTFGEAGGQSGPEADKVMHAMLETDGGITLMASDTPEGMEYKPGTNISISLSGDDADELRGYWNKLSDGGTVTVPLEKQAWGDEFGMCFDRFGIPWMVNIGRPTT